MQLLLQEAWAGRDGEKKIIDLDHSYMQQRGSVNLSKRILVTFFENQPLALRTHLQMNKNY